MKEKFYNYFLEIYSSSSFETYRKTKTFLISNTIIFLMTIIANTILETRIFGTSAVNNPQIGIVGLLFLITITINLFLLKKGNHLTAVNFSVVVFLFLITMYALSFKTSNLELIIDKIGYSNTLVIFYCCLIGTRKYQTIIATFVSISLNLACFIYIMNFSTTPDQTQQLMSSFIASFCLLLTSGLFAYMTLRINLDIIRKSEIEQKKGLETDSKYAAIMENAPIYVLIINFEGKIIYGSPYGKKFHGYESNELIDQNSFDLIHPEDLSNIRQKFSNLLKSPDSIESMEFRFKIKDGNYVWVGSAARNMLENPFINGILLITLNISKRKAIEEKFSYQAKLLAEVNDIIYATDENFLVTYWNHLAETRLGWKKDEIMGMKFDIFQAEFSNFTKEDVRIGLLEKGFFRSEALLFSKDKESITVDWSCSVLKDISGKTIAFIIVARDISFYKKLQDEIFKSQKFEYIGNLASGLAHHFNNINAAIFGAVSVAKLNIQNPPKALKYLDSITDLIPRSKELTYELLTFSKSHTQRKGFRDITKIIKNTFGLIGSVSNINFKPHIDDNIWLVNYDESRIRQAFGNIFQNSIESISETGSIDLYIKNVVVSSFESMDKNRIIKPGNYVKITTEDTGRGISKENIDKVFELFYSTGFPQKRGLGLSIAKSIISQHDGYIFIKSNENIGTKVDVFLPAILDTSSVFEDKSIKQVKPEDIKILFMDDDENIQDFIVDIFNTPKYELETAKDGEEAISKFQSAFSSNKPFNLVFLDIFISNGFGGKETIKKLLEIDPKIKAIVMSGYEEDQMILNFREYGFKAAISKPFTVDEIKSLINSTLNLPD